MVQALGISLRMYDMADVDEHFAAVSASQKELEPYMPWCHAKYSLDESTAWVASRDSAFLAGAAYDFVIVSSEGRILGACGLNQIDDRNRRANLGYWVRTDATRRGVATAATVLLADWAFANTPLDRLEIMVAKSNVASQRVAEKAGAVREGLLRRRLVEKNGAEDAVIYSILRSDREGRRMR
jgi:RimJ/RimL family protein N-acetyltransferase